MSTSSTTGSYHASYASDEAESSFLRRDRYLRVVRLGLAALIFSLGVSIIGCEGVPLHHYRQTSVYEQAWLPLWPLNLDVRPTIAILACGCVVAALNLVYIVVALLPSVSPFFNPYISRLDPSSYQAPGTIKSEIRTI